MARLMVRQVAFDEVFQDMARLAYKHRPHSKAGKIIVLKVGQKTARAMARGAPGADPNSIYLDDALRERLGVSSGERTEFTIDAGSLWDEFVWGWQATNPVTRVGSRLGICGLGLGLAALVLGFIALFK